MNRPKRVVIESPYAGDVERNVLYARECLLDSLQRNEAPFASHLLYTQTGVLRDEISAERVQGINSALSWLSVAELHVFYLDFGYTEGMIQARMYAATIGIPYEERYLYKAGRQFPNQTEPTSQDLVVHVEKYLKSKEL